MPPLNVDSIKNFLKGNSPQNQMMLLEVFKKHNFKIASLLGIEYARVSYIRGTLPRSQLTLAHAHLDFRKKMLERIGFEKLVEGVHFMERKNSLLETIFSYTAVTIIH